MHHQIPEDIFNSTKLSNIVGSLEEQDVHIWRIHSGFYDELKSYSEYFLSKHEQNRASRFRFRVDHDLFVIGRYITRILLAYYTESTPQSVKITPDSFGKPTCEKNLFFNISHSGDQLLLGFSNSEIGVDIERKDPSVHIEKIVESHFSKNEFQEIKNCTKGERADTFFQIWTKKESLIKAIGKGLSIPLKDFNVANRDGKVLWEFQANEDYGNWYVQNIETEQGFKSAFATQNEVVNLSSFSHDLSNLVRHNKTIVN